MNKQTVLNELLILVEKIKADETITPDEVNDIQDWLDYNAVLFVGEEYDKIVISLQTFIEDGILSKSEIDKLYTAINLIKDGMH